MRRHDDLARLAAEATGATAVTLARVDRARDAAHCAGFALGPPPLREATLRTLRTAVPGYRPDRWSLPLSLSAPCRAAFTGGEVLVWPFGRIASGQSDGAALEVFGSVAGLRYTVHAPMSSACGVVGAVDFEFQRRPRPATVRRATAIAALAGRLLGQDRRVERLRAQLAAARAAEHQAAAAQERVRADIAAMLHGRVQGGLLLAVDRLRRAQEAVATDPAQTARLLADVATELDRLREVEVRAASHRLHPAIIGAGLVPALTELAEWFAATLRISLDVTPAARGLNLPAAVRLAAYRAAEEAVGNVVRHAGTHACEILVGADPSGLHLEVRDAGQGFDPAPTRLGLGLLAARSEVARLRGTLHVASAPGQGTRVVVRLPLS